MIKRPRAARPLPRPNWAPAWCRAVSLAHLWTITRLGLSRLLCLLSVLLVGGMCHAQTMAESMALLDEGKYQEAIAILNTEARRGDAQAQYLLGVLYDNGQGVAQDYKLARSWFEKAAAQGQASAQYHLGFMYEAGRGMPHNNQQALHWYGLAAAGADPNAQYRLALMHLNGFGGKVNATEARKWFAQAAAQGDPQAQRQLASLYAKGLGGTQNKTLAYMWLDIARGLGDQSALRASVELAETMASEAIATAQDWAKQCIAKAYRGCETLRR